MTTQTPTIKTPVILQSIINPINNQTLTYPHNNLTSTPADQISQPTSILINTPLFQIYFLNSNPNFHFIHIIDPTKFFTFTTNYKLSIQFNAESTKSLISKSLTPIRKLYQSNPNHPNLLPLIQKTLTYYLNNQSILIHILTYHNTTPLTYLFNSYTQLKNKTSTTTSANPNLTNLINQITLPS